MASGNNRLNKPILMHRRRPPWARPLTQAEVRQKQAALAVKPVVIQ